MFVLTNKRIQPIEISYVNLFTNRYNYYYHVREERGTFNAEENNVTDKDLDQFDW